MALECPTEVKVVQGALRHYLTGCEYPPIPPIAPMFWVRECSLQVAIKLGLGFALKLVFERVVECPDLVNSPAQWATAW